jgi:hypothetical protein
MKKHSFALQVHLLNLRFKQQQVIIWQGRGGVQDRTIYEDMIFAKMLMEQGLLEKRDFDTYRALSENMANFMKRPNLIVHLDVTPEESLERIKQVLLIFTQSVLDLFCFCFLIAILQRLLLKSHFTFTDSFTMIIYVCCSCC